MSEHARGNPKDRAVSHIERAIEAYERADLAFEALVAHVQSGIDALPATSEAEWIDELRSAWLELEIIYALVIDEQRSISDEEQIDIGQTIIELRRLLGNRNTP